MTTLPQLTAIIPTYRRPQLLRRAIQSILNQSYTDFQICIYDNASGDETAAIVAEFSQKDARVKYHCHAENIGAVANFNYGMSQVKTDFFTFLSDDDIILPRFYELAMAGFEEHPDAIFFAGEVIGMNEAEARAGGAPLHGWSREGYFSPPEGMFEILQGSIPGIAGMVFRRQVLEDFGLFDPTITIGDFDLEVRLAARFPIVVNREPCALFTLQATSNSRVGQANFIYNDYIKVVENVKNDLKIPIDTRQQAALIIQERYRGVTFRAGISNIINKNFAEAHKLANFLASHYGDTKKARLIKILAKISQNLPPFYKILAALYNLNKKRANNKPDPIREKYSYLVQYLKKL